MTTTQDNLGQPLLWSDELLFFVVLRKTITR